MTLGERIRALRNQHEITIEELADASGLSDGYILHLEKGYIRNPHENKLFKIACALGVSVDSLLLEPNYENMRSVIKRIRMLDEQDKKKLYQIVSLYLESNGV